MHHQLISIMYMLYIIYIYMMINNNNEAIMIKYYIQVQSEIVH